MSGPRTIGTLALVAYLTVAGVMHVQAGGFGPAQGAGGGGAATLQEVTDEGAETTDTITVGGLTGPAAEAFAITAASGQRTTLSGGSGPDGELDMFGGAGGTDQNGADSNLRGGAGNGTGGGGAARQIGGAGGASGTGGSAIISGGAGETGGNATINGGDGTSTDGEVSIGTSIASAITIGKAGVTTTLVGTQALTEAAAPSTPAAGTVAIYAKTDGLLYSKDDAGAESLLSSSDMVSGTFTGTWSTNTTYTGTYRWIGPGIMECHVVVALSGVPDDATLTVYPPTGWNLDTSRLTFRPGAVAEALVPGAVYVWDDGASRYGIGMITVASSAATGVFPVLQGGTAGQLTNAVNRTSPFTVGSGDTVTLVFTIPVTAS